MRTNRFFLRTRNRRGRAAATLVAVGTLLASSGLVILAAPAQAASVPICHVHANLKNPYNHANVDNSSTDDPHGHYADAKNSGYTWGAKGAWWNGEWHQPNSPRNDLIPGINLPDDFVVTNDYCDAPVEVGPRSVSPSVTWQEPDCDNGNVATYTLSATEGVDWGEISGEVAPYGTATITAVTMPGYTLPAGWGSPTEHTFEHHFEKAKDCTGPGGDGEGSSGETVTPGSVNVKQPVCTGPGANSDLVVDPPADSADVTYRYNATSHVVTATAMNDTKFVDSNSLPDGWLRESDTIATYYVVQKDPGDCIEDVTPTAPRATQPSCAAPGSLVLQEEDGYDWTGDTSNTVGSHTVVAKAWDGYRIDGQSRWDVDVLAQLTGAACAGDQTPATPAEPTWVEATCTTGPSVDYTDVTGVQYVTDGVMRPGRGVTVTASPTGNYVFADGATSTWSHTFAAKPGNCDDTDGPEDGGDNPGGDDEGDVGDNNDNDTLVSPVYPTAKPATCKRDGKLVVPVQPAGLLVTRTGSVPGDVTFTFAPADGYAFPTGTETEITLTVAAQKTGAKCAEVLGEEEIRDHGSKNSGSNHNAKGGPAVLGTQAVVPTAVAAGLSGVTMTPSTTTSSPQLAQVLVTAGLLMLVAGGWTGLGRRTRGAHES